MALINLENIPHGMVSGMSNDELYFFLPLRVPSEQSFLYPLPSKCFKEGDPTTWYSKTERLGKNSIGQMMLKISESAGIINEVHKSFCACRNRHST